MRLTRRDALLGATAGIVGASALRAGVVASRSDDVDPREGGQVPSEDITTLVRLAEVVYPSKVAVTEGFVRTYVAAHGETHRLRLRETLRDLDAYTASVYGDRFREVSMGERETVLREMGVDAVHPRKDGSIAGRVRYYLVNGLLYAMFTSPKGSRLFGIENPLGFAGGYHGSSSVTEDK